MLETLRLRLASAEGPPQLAILGLLCGFLTGLVTIAFRLLIDGVQMLTLPDATVENFEALPLVYRVAAPVLGGLVIGLIFHIAGRPAVGVVHTMERLSYHQGHLSLRNALYQFFGAAASISCGHSVGREGPSIHLGAASGSLLGQWLTLPNNSIRILLACGVAAAIGASFNTPLAGVVFAMEVVLMEYTITGFAPVILSAVSATALTRLVYGSAPAFAVPSLQLGSVLELPYVLLIGIGIGALAAAFIRLLQFFTPLFAEHPLWLRTTLGGAVVGLCAIPAPEIMGVGYDTVNSALLGQLGLWTMLIVVACKLLATTAAIGLGLPGGLIGPTLFIGATAGGAMGMLAGNVFPGEVSSHAVYAMIGMAAMMGGTLQAPLAALMALLELTANPNILLGGMLAVIAASMTSHVLFGKGPLFMELMRLRGLDYRNDPIAQSLRRVGVAAIMNRSFVRRPHRLTRSEAETALATSPRWLLVQQNEDIVALLPAADLALHLANTEEETIDLLEIPAQRRQVAPIAIQATLQEAFDQLADRKMDALYVIGDERRGKPIYGIVTRRDMEANYRYNGAAFSSPDERTPQ